MGNLPSRAVGVVRRHPALGLLVIALVALVALCLVWHLVAMDHQYPTGMLGGCIVALAVALVVVGAQRWTRATAAIEAVAVPTAAVWRRSPADRAPRPPPAGVLIEAVVLIR